MEVIRELIDGSHARVEEQHVRPAVHRLNDDDGQHIQAHHDAVPQQHLPGKRVYSRFCVTKKKSGANLAADKMRLDKVLRREPLPVQQLDCDATIFAI